MLISVDNIGPINEAHGREAGDRIIAVVQGEEPLGHIDGTHFAILVHSADQEGTWQRDDALRNLVAAHAIPFGDGDLSNTESAGVLSLDASGVNDPKRVVHHALLLLAAALHAAKRAGGNRVERAQSGMAATAA